MATGLRLRVPGRGAIAAAGGARTGVCAAGRGGQRGPSGRADVGGARARRRGGAPAPARARLAAAAALLLRTPAPLLASSASASLLSGGEQGRAHASPPPAPRRQRLPGGSRGGAPRPCSPSSYGGRAAPGPACARRGCCSAQGGAGRGGPARWGPGCSALLERPAPSVAPPHWLRRRSLAWTAVPPLVFLDPARAPSFGVRGGQGGAEGAASQGRRAAKVANSRWRRRARSPRAPGAAATSFRGRRRPRRPRAPVEGEEAGGDGELHPLEEEAGEAWGERKRQNGREGVKV